MAGGSIMICKLIRSGCATWDRYNRPEEVLGVCVAPSYMKKPNGRVEEVAAIATLDRSEDGELLLRFHPGVTGFENYKFHKAFAESVLRWPTKVEEKDIFGRFPDRKFFLNLGSSGYTEWWVTVEVMQEIVRTFIPILDQ